MKETIRLPNDEKLIAIAYLVDSSVLHIRERYKEGKLIKYSYHFMKGNKVIRWDNVPHHKEISSYPHHKRENDKVKESTKMDIDLVLEEIKNFSFTKKPLLKKENEIFSYKEKLYQKK